MFILEGLTEQAQFPRPRDGLGAVTHEELAEGVVDVRFDSAHGEVELTGDLRVRPSLGHELQHLYFALAQRLESRHATTALSSVAGVCRLQGKVFQQPARVDVGCAVVRSIVPW